MNWPSEKILVSPCKHRLPPNITWHFAFGHSWLHFSQLSSVHPHRIGSSLDILGCSSIRVTNFRNPSSVILPNSSRSSLHSSSPFTILSISCGKGIPNSGTMLSAITILLTDHPPLLFNALPEVNKQIP